MGIMMFQPFSELHFSISLVKYLISILIVHYKLKGGIVGHRDIHSVPISAVT